MKHAPPLLASLCLMGSFFITPLFADDDFTQLLAQIDQVTRADDIALEARRVADSHAMAESAAAGGDGIAEPLPTPTLSELLARDTVSPTVPQQAQGSNLVTAQASDPSRRMEELLSGMGLPISGSTVLENGEEVFVAVSPPVAVAMGPGSRGYARSRAVAYSTADLRARARLAEFIGIRVAQERAFQGEVSDWDQEQAGTLRDAAQMVAQGVGEDQLDAQLRALGVDPGVYSGMAPEEKRVTLREKYIEESSTSAAARLIGATTLAVTEGPIDGRQHIVVALILSPGVERLASMALNPQYMERNLPAGSKEAALAKLPLDNDLQLARQFGAQMVTDGHGNAYIVGYGQAPIRNTRALAAAETQAANQARQAIVRFVTESIDSEYLEKLAQTTTVWDDESEEVESLFESMERIRGASEIALQGVERVAGRRVQLDGADMQVVVMLWSPSTRGSAAALRERMQAAGRGAAQRQGAATGASRDDGSAEPSAGQSAGSEF
ncbi:MAG: hypothetical protein EA401_03585 [Planctomycetota bacterium]|nr:MAG: hypothetical protein EA401_03585 [Planctomycetota bacterium]